MGPHYVTLALLGLAVYLRLALNWLLTKDGLEILITCLHFQSAGLAGKRPLGWLQLIFDGKQWCIFSVQCGHQHMYKSD